MSIPRSEGRCEGRLVGFGVCDGKCDRTDTSIVYVSPHESYIMCPVHAAELISDPEHEQGHEDLYPDAWGDASEDQS